MKKYLNFKKFLSGVVCFFALTTTPLTFTSCRNDVSENNNSPSQSISATPVPDVPDATITKAPVSPNMTPQPTAIPVVPDDSVTIARQQIQNILPSERYDISLLSDTLIIDSIKYYTFLVTLKGEAIEPLIIVDQATYALKCISSNNVVSDISLHPLYHTSEDTPPEVTLTWDGSYTATESDGTTHYLTMTPVDDTHFSFTIYTYPSATQTELSGVAEISGNSASFVSESNLIILSFTWKEDSLNLTQHPYDVKPFFTGTYQAAAADTLPSIHIGVDAALQKLLELTPEQAGLSGALSDYYFYALDETEIVHDHLCYHIQAYLPEQQRLLYAAEFYISVDGSKIYRVEDASDGDIEIFSLYE
ncbi:MAG: hypothetical protein IJY09_09390 [Lachnospiraceae bacterium]|nr:hypothetical protein [Lachnospiraceae bacterium]